MQQLQLELFPVGPSMISAQQFKQIKRNCTTSNNMKIDLTREKLLNSQMKFLRKQELVNILRCSLCKGLYRFAHTLIECGHTFCQQCIFNYIRCFKGRNPEVKCPQCHSPLEPCYQKSIIKDVFKQGLADLIEPFYVQEEKTIIRRIESLFPEFDLSFLRDEFSLGHERKLKRNKEEKSLLMSRLPTLVKEKLGISFQNFTEMLLKDEHYNQFLEKMKESTRNDQFVVDFKPRTERDFSLVGINCKLKIQNFQVVRIRKFLQKKLLTRLQKSEEVTREFINLENQRLQIHIGLYVGDLKLEDNQSLEGLPDLRNNPVYYTLETH